MEESITLNKRELKLLKAYMGFHGWRDMLVTYPNKDPLYVKDAHMVKEYGGLRPVFKMSREEIDEFRRKLNI
jgi:hypothetical protein